MADLLILLNAFYSLSKVRWAGGRPGAAGRYSHQNSWPRRAYHMRIYLCIHSLHLLHRIASTASYRICCIASHLLYRIVSAASYRICCIASHLLHRIVSAASHRIYCIKLQRVPNQVQFGRQSINYPRSAPAQFQTIRPSGKGAADGVEF